MSRNPFQCLYWYHIHLKRCDIDLEDKNLTYAINILTLHFYEVRQNLFQLLRSNHNNTIVTCRFLPPNYDFDPEHGNLMYMQGNLLTVHNISVKYDGTVFSIYILHRKIAFVEVCRFHGLPSVCLSVRPQ